MDKKIITKKYKDPEVSVVLFDDRTFVNNGVGTSELQFDAGDGSGAHDISGGGPGDDEWIS